MSGRTSTFMSPMGDRSCAIRQKFDVVQMTLVDTWASTAAGAFALSENSLYTEEAFREYFEHLKPDGMIAITRWEFQQPREACAWFRSRCKPCTSWAWPTPAGNFLVVSEGNFNKDGIPVVVLAKRTAFTPDEQARIRAHSQPIRSCFLCIRHRIPT